MQRQFRASADLQTKQAVINLAKMAASRKWPIILVEMDGASETYPEIFAEASKTKHVVVAKSGNNGSEPIFDVCDRFHIGSERFVVCGVNTDACVLSTVRGLIRANHQTDVFVVKDACNTDNAFTWSSFITDNRLHLTTLNHLVNALAANIAA